MAANPLADSRRRSQSRASTSSMHSSSTQPNLDPSFADLYSSQWLDEGTHHNPQHNQNQQAHHHLAHHTHQQQQPQQQHHHHQQHNGVSRVKDMAAVNVHPLTPEDIILQAASHIAAGHDFSGLDASMNTSLAGNGSQPFPPQGHANGLNHQQPLPGDSFSADNSFADLDSQMVDRDPNDDGDSSLAGLSGGASKPPRSSANNELEMRQLFNANKNRNLQDVAEELHGNERGPNSERTRQVFAMLWINQVCSKGKGSVPRGRVYANYASRCATERITVLNPASFGKLVRVLFPGLKTRRLGVRGESKYHYVNFTLAEDDTDLRDSPRLPQVPLLDSANFSQSFNDSNVSSLSAVNGTMPGSAVFSVSGTAGNSGHQRVSSLQQQKQLLQPSLAQQQQPQQQISQQHLPHQRRLSHQEQQQQQQQQQQQHQFQNRLQTAQTQQFAQQHPRGYTQSLYNQPDAHGIDQLNATAANKTVQNLYLASTADTEPFSQSDPLVLPRIEPFLPGGTDPDAAKSLAALYRSHCTSLVECIRYCKEKTFFHLYTSFQGTLTMPVQKLFANPSIAPWVEACDFALYQRMMRIISGLTLQVVPKPVLDTLRNISERLVPHIRESFQGQPVHVVRAKEAPAAIFAGLLDRALRVNLTAHAAANMLSNPANRDQMYMDWIMLVRIRKVAECVPAQGMDDLVNLLLTELRDLLDPVSVSWELESMTLYGEMAARTGRRIGNEERADGGASNVLDRWVNFLQSLPSRFPFASHRDIVWCVQRVGTAVMRDLTIQQGKSFGSWWVTKCWIDEMVAFLAEQGGFLRQISAQQDWTSLTQGSSGLAQRRGPVGGGGSGGDGNGGNGGGGGGSGRDLGRQPGSRYSSGSGSGSDDSGFPPVSQSQPDRAPFPSAPVTQASGNGGDSNSKSHSSSRSRPSLASSLDSISTNDSHHDSNQDMLNMGNGTHDDSGIGIRTPDEDFPMEKFSFTGGENQDDLLVG